MRPILTAHLELLNELNLLNTFNKLIKFIILCTPRLCAPAELMNGFCHFVWHTF